MHQNFDFNNSNNKLKDNSKIVDNNNANINRQNFNICFNINKKILILISISLFLYLGLNLYKDQKRIEISQTKFDEQKAMKEIDELIK